jgi:hypothetical protein
VGHELRQVGGIGGPALDAAADGVVGGRGDGAAALEVAREVVGAGRQGVVGDEEDEEAGAGREAGGPALEEALLEAAVERVDVVGGLR